MIQTSDKIVDSIKSRSQIVHPCMLEFLLKYLSDQTVKGYYNGDHILSVQEEGYLPFELYGLNHFLSSFTELNIFEISILKSYFNSL